MLVVVLLASLSVSQAVTPFKRAIVTKVENVVNYGELKGGRTEKRRAAVSDVVRANNYLLTETESRAELQYDDGSVVRIGQNTVFSFDAESRRLTLDKGALIFFIPKGSGGGEIKTPSLTAAITGTVVFCAAQPGADFLAVWTGELTLKPSGKLVGPGMVARATEAGPIVEPWDTSRASEAALVRMNGRMPGMEEEASPPLTMRVPTAVATEEMMSTAQNLSFGLTHFAPPPMIVEDTEVLVPADTNNPVPSGNGGKFPY